MIRTRIYEEMGMVEPFVLCFVFCVFFLPCLEAVFGCASRADTFVSFAAADQASPAPLFCDIICILKSTFLHIDSSSSSSCTSTACSCCGSIIAAVQW